jgi:hypothetical protein
MMVFLLNSPHLYTNSVIVDENIVVGSIPASADKKTILDYGIYCYNSCFACDHKSIGSVEDVGAKLLKKNRYALAPFYSNPCPLQFLA